MAILYLPAQGHPLPLGEKLEEVFFLFQTHQHRTECCGTENKDRKTGDVIGYDGQLRHTC